MSCSTLAAAICDALLFPVMYQLARTSLWLKMAPDQTAVLLYDQLRRRLRWQFRIGKIGLHRNSQNEIQFLLKSHFLDLRCKRYPAQKH